MERESFTFLADGVSTRKRVRPSPVADLWQNMGTDEIGRMLKQTEQDCVNALDRIIALLRAFGQNAPRGKDVFCGGEDAKRLYPRFCALLGRLEEEQAKLLPGLIGFSRVEAGLDSCRCALADTEEHLRAVTAEETELRELTDRMVSGREAYQHFCGETLRNFRMRSLGLSDAEHDGKNCNAVGLQRLCGELEYAAEQTLGHFPTE